MKYHVHATDGDIGHVQGLLVDEDTWAIRYMVVNTGNWWIGHKVLISPQWISHMQWADAKVSVDLNRDEEAGIYTHYGRPGYWADEADRSRKLDLSRGRRRV
jgi:hypothetical protein